MNDIELKKYVQLPFHPLSRMITYLQIGLLLFSFQIDFGYLKYIFDIIGMFCLYFGLRMIKDASLYFKKAYYCIIVDMIINIAFLSVLATPYYKYADYLYYISVPITYLIIYLIYMGLNKYCHESGCTEFFATYIIIQIIGIIGLFLEGIWEIVSIIMFVIGFIFLVYTLSSVKKDILTHQYLLKLSPVKHNAWFVMFIYILTLCISVSGCFLVTTSRAYHQESSQIYLQSSNKGKSVDKIVEKDDLKLKVKYTITQDEEQCYVHVIDYEWLEFPVYTFMANTTIFKNQEVFYESINNNVYSDKQSYKSILENAQISDWFSISDVCKFKTYVNPWNHQIKGRICITMKSNYKDAFFEIPITFGIKNRPKLLYNEEDDQNIQIIVLIDHQEITTWNEQ